MKYIKPNLMRGTVGLICLASIFAGAWLLWGIGGALFSVGLLVFIDASGDEAIERITNTTRCKDQAEDH